MFLGLDISTSVIGWSILDKDGKLIDYGNITFKQKKHGKNLFLKMDHFKEEFIRSVGKYFGKIKHWAVEEAVKKFQGGKSTANTIYVCASFNFGVAHEVYTMLGFEPTYIPVSTARKSAGLKVPRGLDKNAKKSYIVDWCKSNFPSFDLEYTRTGSYKPYMFDMADSIVIAKSLRIINERSSS